MSPISARSIWFAELGFQRSALTAALTGWEIFKLLHRSSKDCPLATNEKRVFDFYPLEDRVLLSGEGLDGLDAVDVHADLADTLLAEAAAMADADGQAPDPPSQQQASAPDEFLAESDFAEGVALDVNLRLEVIFIDAAVENPDILLADLQPADPAVQRLVFTLQADRDGVEQITEQLAGLSGVDALHIVSHGDGQGIQLGDARLDVDTAAGYAGQIASWAGALDADSDLLIYGCDLASTEDGRALIDSISALCDCDVAASDDATGHETLGGDWDLEYQFGVIDTSVAFGTAAQNTWYGLLATTSFQDGNGNGYNSTVDTYLDEGNATANNSTNVDLQVDMNDGAGDPTTQALIRFDNIFGTGTGQIPYNVMITSATLTVNVNNVSDAGATVSMHEMLAGWADTDTWSSTGGILIDDLEAAVVADSILSTPATMGSVTFTGLENRVQSWIDGASANNGWVITLSGSTNGWDFDSSESANKPTLNVTYVMPGSQASAAHTLTVDTANDVLDGDATSIDALLANKGADGLISLREAIWATNNTTNIDASTPDVINFAIGSGAQTIMVGAGGLPTITDAIDLDATTQTGYAGTPLITLDGTNATGSTGGIVLRTNDSLVSGFIVHSFPDEGIEIDGSTGFGDNNIIENNWVGITSAGAAAGNLDDGILVSEFADNNEIRNNIVGSSGGDGIDIRNNSTGNWVWGNTIGISSDGTTVRANAGHGLHLNGTATGNIIGTDRDSINDLADAM